MCVNFTELDILFGLSCGVDNYFLAYYTMLFLSDHIYLMKLLI